MTRDEGVALIKQHLSFRQSLDSEIVTNMKFAQIALESGPTKPWFLVSEDSFATLTVDDERLALPDDFLEETEDAVVKYRPDDWPDEEEVDLVKDQYDVLRKNFACEAPGAPKAYALLGNYFRFFPLPDEAYTIRMIYFKKDTVLTTNVENGWLKHVPLLLLGSAGLLIAGGPIRDKTAYDLFSGWVSAGKALLLSQNVSREMANMQMQIGGPSV